MDESAFFPDFLYTNTGVFELESNRLKIFSKISPFILNSKGEVTEIEGLHLNEKLLSILSYHLFSFGFLTEIVDSNLIKVVSRNSFSTINSIRIDLHILLNNYSDAVASMVSYSNDISINLKNIIDSKECIKREILLFIKS